MTKRTTKGDPTKAIGYLRVSTEDQHLGPSAQAAALDRWAAANGVVIVAVFSDLGVSGGAPLDRRPGLLAALSALRSHGAGVLAVARRDRVARDVSTARLIEREAERSGARIVSTAGEGDGDSPEAVFQRTISDAVAELERGKIRQRTRDALQVKRARGERVGSVPYGYRVGTDGVHLVADEAEQRIVREVRALRSQGMSLRAIGAALESRGYLPRGGARWNPKTVRSIATAEGMVAA